MTRDNDRSTVGRAMDVEPESFDRERIWRGIQQAQVQRRRRRQAVQSVVAAAAVGVLWFSTTRTDTPPEALSLGDTALRNVVGELEASVRARWTSIDSHEQIRLAGDLAVVDSVIAELQYDRSRSSVELALMTEQADQVLEMKAQLLRDVAAHLTSVNRNSQ